MRASRLFTLLALAIAIVALAGALPARPALAQAAPKPDYRAWNLRANFTGGSARVVLTTYEGKYSPPEVWNWTATDISSQCVKRGPGTIGYAGGEASFPGNAYLECALPTGLLGDYSSDRCEAEAGGFWFFSAEGKLPSTSQSNPIIGASNATFLFGLPGNGSQARTRVQLPGLSGPVGYQTPIWTRDATGNEVLIGQYGPLIIEASETLDLLTNLSAGWKPFFNGVTVAEVGHRMSSAASVSVWETGAGPLRYEGPPAAVLFGRNPASGSNYSGRLSYAEVDPPGCTVK